MSDKKARLVYRRANGIHRSTEVLLGRHLANWRCIPLEMYGLMPCTTCECFSKQTLECVYHVISHEVLNVIRDLYADKPQYPEIEVVEEER